jgi:RNA polymerase sigma factor (TIGR02999 family)
MVADAQGDREFLEQTAEWLREGGGDGALADALPRVYDELRELANSYLRRERPGHTLQPTALVHEAYLRLRKQRNVDWTNHAQFLGIAARMMRRILVNHAEARATQKRGGGATHVNLDTALAVLDSEAIPTLDVDQALTELERVDPRQAQIAELRFFGGLTVPETADALGISAATVKREWTVAKMFLEQELSHQNR